MLPKHTRAVKCLSGANALARLCLEVVLALTRILVQNKKNNIHSPPQWRHQKMKQAKLNGWNPTQCLKKEPSVASHVLSPLFQNHHNNACKYNGITMLAL